MANPGEVESTTRDVLAEFCNYGLMFTALDVSNEVKTRITGVRHREVSPVVRELFEGDELDDYTRSLIDVTTPQGKTVQAYLYHSTGADPANYGQQQREQRAAAPVLDTSSNASSSSSSTAAAAPAPAAQRKPQPKPAGAATSTDDGSNELLVGIAGDGSATLPRSFLERAGIRADEIALDSAGFGSGLQLSEAEDDDDDDEDDDDAPLEVLEYESGGQQLRIPASYLSAFDRQAGLRARIELGSIKLEPA